MTKYKSSVRLENKDEIVSIINQQLADTFDLYSQLKQAHWNVKGMQFYSLHLLFDKLAEEVLEYVDMLAERATTLGGVAKGTIRMTAKTSRLPFSPDTFDNSEFTLKKLIERYVLVAESTRIAIDSADSLGDKVSSDLFTEITSGLDKGVWFLESHLL